MLRRTIRSQKGMASVEFTGVAMVIMALAFGIVEFGSLIRAQAVVTNVTREGGSLASRDLKNGSSLLQLLEASTWPLNFVCPAEDPNCVQSEQDSKFKIYITKVDAGTSDSISPTCHTPLESGKLLVDIGETPPAGSGMTKPNDDPHCGLTEELWETLTYKQDYGTSLLSQLTVVKVYYRHDPLTPLSALLKTVPYFGDGTVTILNFDSTGAMSEPPYVANYDSFLVGSRAVF
ncbi:TadE/TadG family type IV pilus assembly protein [Candidatus Nitrospira salsa]